MPRANQGSSWCIVCSCARRPVGLRDDDGQLTLQRAYNFEYSDTGDNRLKGSVVMQGHRVALLNVGLRVLH